MTNKIHPTALIEDSVKLGKNNIIGPYCVLTGNIKLGNGNELKSHVVMHGHGKTTIGDNNIFFPFSSFNVPQDKKFAGEETAKLEIGDRNIFREYSTANPGTEAGSMLTKIGNDNLFMMSSHIAHDCEIGSNIVMANSVAIAGHVTIGDYATIGGLSAVLQRTRIGEHAMIGGMSAVAGDVIPYGMVVGDRAYLAGLNIVGLRRRGFSKESMHGLRHAYEIVFAESADRNFSERIEFASEEFKSCAEAQNMLKFISDNSLASRSLCKPR